MPEVCVLVEGRKRLWKRIWDRICRREPGQVLLLRANIEYENEVLMTPKVWGPALQAAISVFDGTPEGISLTDGEYQIVGIFHMTPSACLRHLKDNPIRLKDIAKAKPKAVPDSVVDQEKDAAGFEALEKSAST